VVEINAQNVTESLRFELGLYAQRMLLRVQGGAVWMNVLDGLVVQRQTSPFPHIINVQGFTAILLFLEGVLTRLVGGTFLEICESVSTLGKRITEKAYQTQRDFDTRRGWSI
jgi:hypothetical protein